MDQEKARPAWAAPTPCLPSVAALRARRSGDSSRASLTRKFALKKRVPKTVPSLNSAQIALFSQGLGIALFFQGLKSCRASLSLERWRGGLNE
jgi:hypothetical protein